jgi:sigma-B regulation protein RsbU (phosphoserine phosphatase)
MRILVAEDDAVSRRALELTLKQWGYEVLLAGDGAEAWQVLQEKEIPELAIVDWMMPALDGLELCRKVRQSPQTTPLYIILLTARHSKDDVIQGLDAGADDYITKPFDRNELLARVKVGRRVVGFQTSLAKRAQELADLLARMKRLQGLLPICSYCKRIRDDQNYWQQVESYVSEHSEAEFSHGICPDCYDRVVKPKFERSADRRETSQ